MKIGIVGPTADARSLPFDAQRTINLYPVKDKAGKEVSALYGTPGLVSFATFGAGPIRGCLASDDGNAYFVSAAHLYSVSSLGVAENLGTLEGTTGKVSMAENSTQLAICDGSSLYIYTYETGVFAKVTDVDIPTCGVVASIDGYFVVNSLNTGRFYISALNDGTSWDALDFATAESSHDNLITIVNAVGQLWLFGSNTTEIWTDSGDSVFPFKRITGAKMEVGCLAAHAAVSVDNSVIWVGRDKFGQGIVYRAKGFSPMRISTESIEKKIQAATSPEDLCAFSYQEEGHLFYVLTGGGLETTLVFDITTQEWHERAYLNSDGDLESHRAYCYMFCYGKHLVGDKELGKVYEQKLDYYDDDGEEIARERIYTHLSDENKRIRYNNLEIGFETGVGLQSGNGSNPLVSLQLSKDGARTWSDSHTATIGASGQYQTNVCFRRLGVAQQMTFKIRITDPIKVAIVGSYLT
jgi:hypothetical protein